MKRPAFLSGFLMMLVGLGLTIAVMFVLPFHKDAAAPCFYLVRMTAVLGFASALAGEKPQRDFKENVRMLIPNASSKGEGRRRPRGRR